MWYERESVSLCLYPPPGEPASALTMATSLTRHVTRLPAILLVLCLCWGVTLGQVGGAPASGANSTMGTSSNSSTPEPSTLSSMQANSGIAKTNETVQTTPSTTAQTTPTTTTSSSTSMAMSTVPSTMASTTPTTVTTTVSSTTMESTSTVSPTTLSSTTPSTTIPSTESSTTPSTTMPSTTPSTTESSTTSSTTMPSTESSTTPSTTIMPSTESSTTPSTTIPSTESSTTPSTTMPSTTPSTTMPSTVSSTTPSTTLPSTTPLSTLDPTAIPAAGSTESMKSTEAPISTPGGILGRGTSSVPTISQTDFKTESMKPMVTETTTMLPHLASSTLATGAPIGTATAVTASVDNATVVVARTTRPIIRQTSGPTTIRSLPPAIRTTQYPDTSAIRTRKRPDVTTGRMIPPQTTRMTQRQTMTMVPPVRSSPLHTTSMPISTTAYDHSRDQTGSDMTSPPGRATTTVPVMTKSLPVMTTPPHVAKTTKITQPTPRKVTTTLPTIPMVQTTERPEITKDVTYSIRFQGDCSIILSDTSVREKFEQNFIEKYSVELGVPRDNILIQDISCGSVDVMFTLMGIQESKVEKSLQEVVSQSVPLVVNADGQTYAYIPNGYKLDDPSRIQSTTPSILEDSSDPTILSTPPPSGLRSVDMIIIIVVSIIGGLLIVIIIALIIHECRRRSHTKSFDLRGTPRPHIHTEDFTLTKMERGPAEYNDYGLVVNSTANGHTRTPQVGVATIVETPNNHHNGDAMHNGYPKAGKEQYEPEYDAGPDSPSISLMKSMRTPDIEGGIENPSFSSEDILDSGTETDKEMVSSDKGLDSPDHAPLQVYPAAESDSGRQSDSLTEMPYDTPPQHSPRSNLSDNTGSDHTYEPYEAPPTPDIPQSPAHHEVLMPIEEVGYPKEEAEAPSPPQSPASADTLTHSPEHGSYEMVETRSPGKRESDFFAPAEGATAF